MDLQEEWNNMNNEVLLKTDTELSARDLLIKKESGSFLQTIRKNLQTKLFCAKMIALPAFICGIFAKGEQAYLLLFVSAAYTVGYYLMLKKMKKLNFESDYSNSTKELIVKELETIRSSLRIEEIWGYIFIPISGPIGFLLFNLIVKGRSLSALSHDPKMVYSMTGLILLSIPLIYLAGKMNYMAFGRYIHKLKENLQYME